MDFNDFIKGNEQKVVTVWTIVHFIFGILAYKIGMPIPHWIALQCVFEIGENSKIGLDASEKISKFLKPIIGGDAWFKYDGDSFANTAGDVMAGTLGWMLAKWLNGGLY